MVDNQTEKPNGRPRKEVDWEQFSKLCAMQCTVDEIAAWFNVSRRTLDVRVEEEFGCTFISAFKMFRQKGLISLRRMQYKSAERGSVPMQKWLGQQWLGQSEKQDVNQNIDHNVKHERLLRHVENLNTQKEIEEGSGNEEQSRIDEPRSES